MVGPGGFASDCAGCLHFLGGCLLRSAFVVFLLKALLFVVAGNVWRTSLDHDLSSFASPSSCFRFMLGGVSINRVPFRPVLWSDL